MAAEWYYAEPGGEKAGPVDASDLARKLSFGSLDRDTALVWKPGMKEWVLASSLELFDASETLPVETSESRSQSETDPVPSAEQSPAAKSPRRISSVKLFVAHVVIQILGAVLMMIPLFSVVTKDPKNPPTEVELKEFISQPDVMGQMAPGFILIILGSIIAAVIVFRAWKQLLADTPKSQMPLITAILLLVPIVSLFWRFFAVWHWARQWNKGRSGKPIPETLFLVACLCMALGTLFPTAAIVGIFSLWTSLFFMSKVIDRANQQPS